MIEAIPVLFGRNWNKYGRLRHEDDVNNAFMSSGSVVVTNKIGPIYVFTGESNDLQKIASNKLNTSFDRRINTCPCPMNGKNKYGADGKSLT